MLQKCLQQAIDTTEFAGRGLIPKIADDITDRIAIATGFTFKPGRLFYIYRHQLSEHEVDVQEKNAIAQFAQYHNWEHFLQSQQTKQNIQSTSPLQFLLYIILFMVCIYTIFSVASYVFF